MNTLPNIVENPYFQFPLCVLSFGSTVKERLNKIIYFCLVDTGHKLFRKLSVDEQREFLCGKTASPENPHGLNPHMWEHCAAAYGAHILGVKYSNLSSVLEGYCELWSYINMFEDTFGRDARVRIKKDWVFNARDNQGLTYREFSVLCAIYSAIGNKEIAIVRRDRVRHCALGYRTAAIMGWLLDIRADNAQSLTERQLCGTVARLHQKKFFARCTVGRRITYYSIRLDNEAFRKKVLERRTYSGFFHASQAAQDQLLTAAIKQKRREAAKSETKTPSPAPRFKFTPPGDSH